MNTTKNFYGANGNTLAIASGNSSFQANGGSPKNFYGAIGNTLSIVSGPSKFNAAGPTGTIVTVPVTYSDGSSLDNAGNLSNSAGAVVATYVASYSPTTGLITYGDGTTELMSALIAPTTATTTSSTTATTAAVTPVTATPTPCGCGGDDNNGMGGMNNWPSIGCFAGAFVLGALVSYLIVRKD